MKMFVLRPPTFTPFKGPILFLAGPIQGAADWQHEAIKWFRRQQHGDFSIASPRRIGRESQKFGNRKFASQVGWESHHLRLAAEQGVVMFWLAREENHCCYRAFAQTSRFEIAEWMVRAQLSRVRLVVGIDPKFSGRRYLLQRFAEACPAIPILDSLETTCSLAHRLITSLDF